MVDLVNIRPQAPWEGPPVPAVTKATWPRLGETAGSYVQALDRLVFARGKKPVLPDVVNMVYQSVSLAALDATVKPGVMRPWVQTIEERVAAEGKFDKMSVLYIDFPVPPVFWDYKCMKCRFWQEPEACTTVDGRISPQGWCTIWLPPDGVKPLTWVGDLLRGDW